LQEKGGEVCGGAKFQEETQEDFQIA